MKSLIILVVCLFELASSSPLEVIIQEESEDTFEGDILLTPDQAAIIEELIKGDAGARKAHSDVATRWPRGVVPYEIDFDTLKYQENFFLSDYTCFGTDRDLRSVFCLENLHSYGFSEGFFCMIKLTISGYNCKAFRKAWAVHT